MPEALGAQTQDNEENDAVDDRVRDKHDGLLWMFCHDVFYRIGAARSQHIKGFTSGDSYRMRFPIPGSQEFAPLPFYFVW